MITSRLWRTFALFPIATVAAAQSRINCPPGQRVVPDYGYNGIECINCELNSSSPNWIEFHAPARLRDMRSDGPAAGKLMEGDTLIAINGNDIATSAASGIYSRATPGETVDFTVRRNGNTVKVAILAGGKCSAGRAAESDLRFGVMYGGLLRSRLADESLLALRVPSASRLRVVIPHVVEPRITVSKVVLPRVVLPYVISRDTDVPFMTFPRVIVPGQMYREPSSSFFRRARPDSSRGWLGIGISTSVTAESMLARTVTMRPFTQIPRVTAVARDGPADAAGLEVGDRLIAVDGMSLLTNGGAERFRNPTPGVALSMVYVRGGEEHTVSITPGVAPTSAPPLRR